MLLPSPNFDIVQEKSRFMTGRIVFAVTKANGDADK
jgi:hypothetical protein